MKAVAEAPAKVIITGEHFVVHGAWALAAAIPRKTRVVVEASERLEVCSNAFPDARSPQLEPFRVVVRGMSEKYSFPAKLKATIESGVPGGSGLGSSASSLVALASAVSRYNALGLGLGDIVQASMRGERMVHGRPSGIDLEVCARGGVLLFKPGSDPRRVSFRGKRGILISSSGTSRSSKPQISRVSEAEQRFPDLFAGLARSVSDIGLEAAKRLQEGDMKGLGNIFSLSHAILSGLGVSNEALDRLVDASLSLGSYGAKLTGAGGGGSVVSVAPERKEKSVISGLKARGFETFKTNVPTGGVKSWLEQ